MQKATVHIQGLNYRFDDRDAPDGVCRGLSNLYPVGNPKAPHWQPVKSASEYYRFQDINLNRSFDIIDGYVYQRANANNLLLYIRESGRGEYVLAYKTLDSVGAITSDAEVVLFNLETKSSAIDVQFEQIGEQVTVCVTVNEEPFELLTVMTAKGQVRAYSSVCPVQTPELRVEQNVGMFIDEEQWSFFDLYSKKGSPSNYARSNGASWWSESITDAKPLVIKDNNFWVFKYGLELNDGTTVNVRHTSIMAVHYYERASRNGESVNHTLFATTSFLFSHGAISSSPEWADRIKGIVIFASDEVGYKKFYRLPLNPQNLYLKSHDEFLAEELFDADNLQANNSIKCSTIASYNKQLLLGGAEYHVPQPEILWQIDQAYPTMDLLLTAVIDTGGKTVVTERLYRGRHYKTAKAFIHPDPRTTEFYLTLTENGIRVGAMKVVVPKPGGQSYVDFAGGAFVYNPEAQLYNSAFNNWGRSQDRPVEDIFAQAVIAPAVTDNKESDYNRLLVSEPYITSKFLGRNALYVGEDSDDRIMAFGTNALPISTGQFGEYPLYVFCRRSIWALAVGSGDVSFSRISPVSVGGSVTGKYALANINSLIVFASKEGIKTLPDQGAPLSLPIQNSVSNDDILQWINEDTTIGHFVDQATGRDEVWVSTANGIYAYSLPFKRWFVIGQGQRRFINFGDRLLSIYDGVLYEEGAGPEMVGNISTPKLDMDMPDVIKRFRSLFVRTSNSLKQHLSNATGYWLDFNLGGVTERFWELNIEFEPRYAHRLRRHRTYVDSGYTGGYAGAYGYSYPSDEASTVIVDRG